MSSNRYPHVIRLVRRPAWWVPLALGVFLGAAGLGLVLWPFLAATWALALLFGSTLVASGLTLLASFRRTLAATISGLMLIVCGLFAVVFADVTASALVAFFGVSLVLLGTLGLGTGLRLFGSTAVVLIPSLLLIALGIFTLVWPTVALQVVAVACGVLSLTLGSTLVWWAFRLRRLRVTETLVWSDPS